MKGETLDCCDNYGGWYSGTVVKVRRKDNGGKMVKVTFKIYDASGEKYEKGQTYFGLSDSYDTD